VKEKETSSPAQLPTTPILTTYEMDNLSLIEIDTLISPTSTYSPSPSPSPTTPSNKKQPRRNFFKSTS